MRVCLFSKYGESSNLLYSGARWGLEKNNIPYIDINIDKVRNTKPPFWISIPQLTPKTPHPQDKVILKKIQLFRPDLILFLQYNALQFLVDNGNELKATLKSGGKIGFWYVDLAPEINENFLLGKYIDILFLSNAGQLKEYQKKWNLKQVVFMPQGCFLSNTFPTVKKYSYEIVFIGRRQSSDPRYKERNTLLDVFKVKIGLKEFDKFLELNQIISVYQQSKIVLGTSWRNDVELYSSDRIFNVLGAGGFYLCSYFPGIEKLFKNHLHLVWFKTAEEGIRLASYYLNHNRKREKIAYRGYMLAKGKHTYEKRIKNITDIIKNKVNDFKGFL